MKKYSTKSFSVIEVILAAALFVILSTGAVSVILQGLDSNRLGEEQTIANQYASEGIEAIRSIKNQAFTNLVNSAGVGVTQSGGVWIFSGSNNVLSSKYTRVLTVSDVQRDGSGNIVTSGGTLDPLTKKITSTVSWNFTPTRSDSVALTSYLTDWRSNINFGTCTVYCQQMFSYISGTCRQSAGQCNSNGETYQSGGDIYCTGGPNADTCCCAGPTPTPSPTPIVTATPTPTVGPTVTPTLTPTPITCPSYCVTNGYGTGTCRQNAGQCTSHGETNLPAGNVYCTGGPNADTCCCI